MGNALPRAVALLLLPLYTTVLSPAEYGELSLLLSLGVAASFAFTQGVDSSLFRFAYGLEDLRERHAYALASWGRVVRNAPLIALGIGVLCVPLAAALPLIGIADLALVLLGYGLIAIGTYIPLSVMRVEERVGDFLRLTAFSTVATSGLTVAMVVGFDWGVRGWLVATAVAAAATIAFAARLIGAPRRDERFDGLVGDSVAAGRPLVPHYLSHWGLQFADRAVLAGLVAPSALGVYGLAGNFAVPGLVLVQGVAQALMPRYGRLAANPSSAQEISAFASAVRKQVVVVATSTALLACILPLVIRAVTPNAYHEASTVVIWLVLGYGLLGLYYIPSNMLAVTHGRPRFLAFITVACAGVNVAIVVAVSQPDNIVAAAAATPIAYFLLLCGTLALERYETRGEVRTFTFPASFTVATAGSSLVAFSCFQLVVGGASPLYGLLASVGTASAVLGFVVDAGLRRSREVRSRG